VERGGRGSGRSEAKGEEIRKKEVGSQESEVSRFRRQKTQNPRECWVLLNNFKEEICMATQDYLQKSSDGSSISGLNDSMVKQDTANNRIGVGTPTPRATLEVDGDFITKGPWHDVRAYGAKGDGSTDDTAALQAAIDAAGNNSTTFLPAGVYKITQKLRVHGGMTLAGANRVFSHIVADIPAKTGTAYFTNGSTTVTIDAQTSGSLAEGDYIKVAADGFEVLGEIANINGNNVTLVDNYAGQGSQNPLTYATISPVLEVMCDTIRGDASELTIRDLHISSEQDKEQVGIDVYRSLFVNIENVDIEKMYVGIYLSRLDISIKHPKIIDCRTGIHFGSNTNPEDWSNASSVYGGWIGGCTEYGIRFVNAYSNSIYSTTIEGMGADTAVAGVDFTKTSGSNSLVGCHIECCRTSLVRIASGGNRIMNCSLVQGLATEIIHWEPGFGEGTDGNLVLGNGMGGVVGAERKEAILSNVAIGKPNPGAKLTVKNDLVQGLYEIAVKDGTGTTVISFEGPGSDKLQTDAFSTTVTAFKNSGSEQLYTKDGPSTTVKTTNGAFANVAVNDRITAHDESRIVTGKSSDVEVTVDSSVDWSAGYPFVYQKPVFAGFSTRMQLIAGAGPEKRRITNITDSFTVTVDSPVDWNNSGSGYTFNSQYPVFANFVPGVQLFANSEMRTITAVTDDFTVIVDEYWELSGAKDYQYKWPLLNLCDGAASKVFVNPDGNTGVGKAHPLYNLDVAAVIPVGRAMYHYNGGTWGLIDGESMGNYTGSTPSVTYRVQIEQHLGSSIASFGSGPTGYTVVTTPSTQGLVDGDVVQITSTSGYYDGEYPAFLIGPTTFTIPIAYNGDDTGAWERKNDTFKWSDQGGNPPASWNAENVRITASIPQLLNNGVYFCFTNKFGHTAGDYWEFVTGTDFLVDPLQVSDHTGNSLLVVKDNGNTGLGTVAPGEKFEVNGGGAGVGGRILSGDSSSLAAWQVGRASPDVTLGVAAAATNWANEAAAGDAVLRTETPSQKLFLDTYTGTGIVVNNNSVGIGEPNPGSKLSVAGNASIGSAYYAETAAPENGMIVEGSVGINTFQPGEKLEVKGNIYINAEDKGIIIDADGNKRIGFMKYSGKEAGIWRNPEQDFEIGRVADGSAITSPTGFTTDVYVGGNGNVGVNTVTPENKLTVAGNASIGSSYAGTAAPENGMIVEGRLGVGTSEPTSGTMLDVNGNIKIGASDYFYLGASDTDGSWRFHRSGNNLRFERRESSSWVDKGGFNA
jgi:hypothetical protein